MSDGSSGNWVVTEDLRFVRNPLLFGRHIAELRASDNALVRSYVWGLDLSDAQAGTAPQQGAGGVGGLLWVTLDTGSGPAAGTHLAAYDGNGNIVAPSAASGGSESARYEYGPFGEPLRLTGPAAALYPYRFSTKRTCNTTDLVLYEYRAYSPRLGKWANRDPIEEAGGENLYGFGYNNPIYYVDALGLADLKYSSEGKAYVDAHRPHFYYIDRIVDESGKRSSPVSYVFQMVRQKNPCPGGICNSGGTGDSSSFVVATVKNVSKCSLEVECRCSISSASVTFAPQEVGGFLVKGHVLGETFRKAFTPVSDDQRPGWFIAAGAGSISRTQTFVLSSGASNELYRGITVTALPPNMVGSGFIESMNGACTCTSQ
jgi:RHS repeat-associated protein